MEYLGGFDPSPIDLESSGIIFCCTPATTDLGGFDNERPFFWLGNPTKMVDFSAMFHCQRVYNIWLVVLTILKNDGVRQWGWDDIPCIMENNPVIFETSNQGYIISNLGYKSMVQTLHHRDLQ